MEAIKDTVASVLKKLSAKKSETQDGDPEEWLKKVLTKKELEHIKFKYFKKGLLGVSVDSSSWLYKLSYYYILTGLQGRERVLKVRMCM